MRRLEYEEGPLSQPDTHAVGASGFASSLIVNDVDWEAFPVETSCQSSSLSDTSDPPRFEASSLGGVLPSDHFSIAIRSCSNAQRSNVTPPTQTAQHSRPYQHHVRGTLDDSSSSFRSFSTSVLGERSFLVMQQDVIEFQVKKLPPSCLLPPYYEHESSKGDEESDGSDNSTEENEQPA